MKINKHAIRMATMLFFIALAVQAHAQDISSDIITTTFPNIQPEIINTIDRFYELSEKSIRTGYNVTLENDSAFKITMGTRDRYIITNNFTDNAVTLIFISSGQTLFNRQLNAGDYVIFKIDDLNLQFILHSANESAAEVELKLFEQQVPEDVEYFELFDVQVRLAENVIHNPTELTALIEFTNFGEGPSNIRTIYSIIDLSGKEYYTGVDEKVVETNEVEIKTFENLDIPYGDYIIKTTIYYGKNQEATSEDFFTYSKVPTFELLMQPIFFITIISVGLVLVVLFRKKEEAKKKAH